MSPSTVSILIPCYNAEKYIGAALESALAQTWPHKEIIVVDDGSTDGSPEILEKFRPQAVKVIRQKNQGQCAAANRALAEAQGDYIKFFDADDLLAPLTIELQLKRLAGSTTEVASAEWGRFHGDNLTTFKLNPEKVWHDMNPLDWLVESWMNARPMMQCALWLIPRNILEKAGGWDERLSLINDFEFFARVLCHCQNVLFTPGARLYYRSGIQGSLSGQKSRPAVESAFLSLMTGTAHLLARRDDSRVRLACANILQEFVYQNYPNHADLVEKIETRIKELGGSNLPPSGGWRFGKLSQVIGWKTARKVQVWTGYRG